jgi:4-hydroxy-tetrahydrodipicolinate synthase
MITDSTFIGTGVAIITPFTPQNTIDFIALEKVIDLIINNGCNYIVSLGTTGETPSLSFEEKCNILNFTCKHVNNRVPIVIGVGGNNTSVVIAEINALPLHNAVAILSASPYYNKPTQEGLFLHYKTIAQNSPLPIILYNVPSRTGRNLDAETIVKLAHLPNIIGIKEAGDNMQQCMEVLRDKPQSFFVVSGDDALCLSQIACGMQGAISVAANCFPKEFSSMINFALANNFKEARAIHYQLLAAYTLLFQENNPAGIKAFLFAMNLIDSHLRLPLLPVSNNLLEKIKEYLVLSR